MSTLERRHCYLYSASNMTSILYLFLTMFGVTAALPSTYMQLISPIVDNAILYKKPMIIEGIVPRSATLNSFTRDTFTILPTRDPFSFFKFESDNRLVPNDPVKRVDSNYVANNKMIRLARNLPQNVNGEKMYQISNIGDLPMFRFGK